jgi:hypothetical protein
VLRLCYACVTLVLRLCYACVTLGLHLGYTRVVLRLCYACVTLALRLDCTWVTLGLCYACVTLALRLLYACEFNINIRLSRQLSVCHQSDVSLSSLCRLSSIGKHALRMC